MNRTNIPRYAALAMVLTALLVILVAGVAVADVLRDSEGKDKLVGTNGDDELYGLAGDDRLYGEGGDDLLEGTLGNDQLNGGPGNDRMEGGLDRDKAFGATGDDFFKLDGDARADYAFCGSGYDTVRADGNDFIANENGSAGVSDLATGTNPVFNCEKVIVDGVVVVFTPRQAERVTL